VVVSIRRKDCFFCGRTLSWLRVAKRSLFLLYGTCLMRKPFHVQLDSGNALYRCITNDNLMCLFQSMQKAAPRMAHGTRGCPLCSLAVHSPNYLTDDCCFCGQAPLYLRTLLTLYKSGFILSVFFTDARSRRMRPFLVSQTRTIFGYRAFSAAGLRIWNNLQTDLRIPDSLCSRFRQSLKTFLSGKCNERAA